MGNEIPQQLAQFLYSILLGGALALAYDVVRALSRLGGRVWEAMLDTAVGFFAAAALFFFVMAGDGELRLFILAGSLGGAVLFFCLLSPVLRPVLAFCVRLMRIPLRIGHIFLKKAQNFFKKVFSFPGKWFTIMVVITQKLTRRERGHGTKAETIEDSSQQ